MIKTNEELSFRVSSTPIGTYLDCPRLWAYCVVEGRELDSVPIRFGSLFHGVTEAALLNHDSESIFETTTGSMYWDVSQLEDGDYGGLDPYLKDPGLKEWVWRIFIKACEDPHVQFLLDLDEKQVEHDITPLDVRLGNYGQLARGREDIRWRNEEGILVISDWKTRSSLKYAPFTDEDFRQFPQPVYYAAVEHHANPEPNGIIVEHINVLRESGNVAVYHTHYEVEYLEKMFRYFDNYLIPAMEEAYQTAKLDQQVNLVERDTSACFKYGQCSFYKMCSPTAQFAGESFLDVAAREVEMEILSKETPPEVKALQVPDKPISVLGPSTGHRCGLLHGAEIYTLGDMRAYINSGMSLQNITGIGPVLEQDYIESLEAFYSEYVEESADVE